MLYRVEMLQKDEKPEYTLNNTIVARNLSLEEVKMLISVLAKFKVSFKVEIEESEE